MVFSSYKVYLFEGGLFFIEAMDTTGRFTSAGVENLGLKVYITELNRNFHLINRICPLGCEAISDLLG